MNLITFMVLDDYQEGGIPVAGALSNREDKLVVINILEAIKEVSKAVFCLDYTFHYIYCSLNISRAMRNCFIGTLAI